MKYLNSILKLVTAIILILSMQNCTKEVEREFPRIRTLPCKILENGALFKGEISNFKSTTLEDYGFIYCEGELNPDSELQYISLGQDLGSLSYEFALTTGLEEGKIYSYFAYAISNGILSVGSDYGFISGGSDPPKLISFNPSEGFIGDSVHIYCANLIGSGSSYEVDFNGIPATTTKFNDSILLSQVPLTLRDNESVISVSAYGEEASFASKFSLLTPDIVSFTPDVVYPLDTVTIYGSNFPENASIMDVYFNSKEGVILSSSTDEIKVIAPIPADSINTIKVEIISGQFDIADETIKILFPSGNDFFPKTGTYGDLVNIYGEGIGLYPIENVSFNSTIATIISLSPDEIVVSVPPLVGGCEALITVQYETLGVIGFFESYSINPGEITSLSSSSIEIGSELIIYGNNFNPQNTLVKIGDQIHVPTEASTNQLKVKVSLLLTEGDQAIGVQTCGDFNFYEESLIVLPATWKSVENFPGGKAYKMGWFTINEYGYVGLGTREANNHISEFWRYDPSLNEWIEIAQFPGSTRVHPHGFSINGKGYVGGGFDMDAPWRAPLYDFYEYDPVTNSWSNLPSFPGINDLSFMGIAEVIQGKCYVSFSPEEFWLFTPELPSPWSQLSDPPAGLNSYHSTFTLGNKIYLTSGRDYLTDVIDSDVWVYDTQTDSWDKLNDFPGGDRYIGTGFAVEGIGYVGLGYDRTDFYNDIWRYNDSNDSWTLVETFPGEHRGHAFDLVFEDHVYIGAGLGYGPTFYENVYRFRPPSSK